MENNGNKNETFRIEAFSDAVFAIAITLLVLEIHVPEVKNDEPLFPALLHDWESHLAFLTGFFTLLICWINHHYMFEHINKSNGMLLLLNGFKLLVISFTPFATALLSHYIGTVQQQTAVTVYAFNFFLMGLAMTTMWLYSVRQGLVTTGSALFLKVSSRFYIFASVLSGAIFLLSFANFGVCMVLFVIMFLVFVFPDRMIKRLTKKQHSGSPAGDTAAG